MMGGAHPTGWRHRLVHPYGRIWYSPQTTQELQPFLWFQEIFAAMIITLL